MDFILLPFWDFLLTHKFFFLYSFSRRKVFGRLSSSRRTFASGKFSRSRIVRKIAHDLKEALILKLSLSVLS